MTKKEIIARYGQAEYDRRAELNRVYAKECYQNLSPNERTDQYEARKDYVAQWCREHPEQVAATNRKAALAWYYRQTPEKRLEIARDRRATRKMKLKSDPEFAADQAAKQHERFVRWSEAHPGLHNERNSEWAKAHPEYRRSIDHARRALGKIDPEFVKFLRSQPCVDCGTTEKQISIGHLIPIKRGGTNHPCNLVAQCRSCNSKQHAKVHPKFAQVNYPEAARYAVAA